MADYSHAEYENGLSFEGHDGNIHMAKWQSSPDRPGRCPLVVHFKDGSVLGDTQFQSPQLMRQFGAQKQNPHDNRYELSIEKSGLWAVCQYENNALVWVSVGMSYADRPSHELTVDDKDILLPMSEGQFFELFGKPLKLREDRTSW